MVVLAQLVRASVCGTEGRGFEPHIPPQVLKGLSLLRPFFIFYTCILKLFVILSIAKNLIPMYGLSLKQLTYNAFKIWAMRINSLQKIPSPAKFILALF